MIKPTRFPRQNRLRASTAALAILAAHPAAADVTPADVWANTQAYLGSFGGQVSAELVAEGAVTELQDFTARFALPMGFGTLEATATGLSMVENGDGTVTFRYADGAALPLALDVPGEGGGTIRAVMRGGSDMLASGDPGDVRYTYDVPEYSVEIAALELSGTLAEAPGTGALGNADVTGMFTVRSTTGEMRITEGDLVTTTLDATYADMDYDIRFSVAEGFSGYQTGTVGASTATARVAMPAGGAAVMALNQALADGMAFELTSSSASTTADQELTADGRVISYSRDTSGPGNATLRLDQAGLLLEGGLEGYSFDQLDPELPLPLKGQFEAAKARIAMPVSAGEDPQSFAMLLDIAGLSLDEALWALFDPAQALPRDPASLTLDLAGEMGTRIDLLDIPALMALEQSGENPFSIHASTLRQFALSAVGASLSSTGDFTFDMSDLTTFDGLPAPTGVLDVQVNGANALIDTLIGMGLVAQDEALGARMMLGLFARPGEGEDSLVSKIEVDGATGAVSANGQRLR